MLVVPVCTQCRPAPFPACGPARPWISIGEAVGCIVRLLLLLVLAGFALAAAGAMGIPGAEAALAAAGWPAVTSALTGQMGAYFPTIGEGFAQAIGRGWNLLPSAPWGAVPDAAGRLGGQITASLGPPVGDSTRWGLSAIHSARDQLADLATTLTRSPSGEPLGTGRVAIYAVGWLLVVGLVAWCLLRHLARWVSGVWRCVTANRHHHRRRSSTARG